MAIFSKACAFNSRNMHLNHNISIPNSSDKLNFVWSHSSAFTLQTQTKNLDFQSFFYLQNNLRWLLLGRGVHPIPDDMQLNKVQLFKIYQRLYNPLALLLSDLENQSKNLKFNSFSPLKEFWWLPSMKRVHLPPKNIYLNKVY